MEDSKMLRIYGVEGWTLKITSTYVQSCSIAGFQNFLKTTKRREVKYPGHIFRNEKCNLPHLIMEGKNENKRGIGSKKNIVAEKS